MPGWVSPRLGIRFKTGEDNELRLLRADGQRFLSMLELETRRCEAEERSELDLRAREQAQQRTERAEKASRAIGREPAS